jgi:hypothetical protein
MGDYGEGMSREHEEVDTPTETGWGRHERHCLLSKLDLPEGAVPCTCGKGRSDE